MDVATSLHLQLNKEFPTLLQTCSFSAEYNVDEDNILGRGRYAVVKKCKNRSTGETYAGKFMKKRRMNEILKELRVLQRSCMQANIVQLFEVHQVGMDIVFLLEQAVGGDLQSVLEAHHHLTEYESRKVIQAVISALEFLHKLKFIHLDIKPQNILLLRHWPDITVKLCDFGLAKGLNDGSPQEIAGTADYIAPEVIAYDKLTTACDMWSTGVVTYVLLSGVCPFRGDNNQEIFVSITRAEYDFDPEPFNDCSAQSVDFMEKLMCPIPKNRLTAEGSLQHDWFRLDLSCSLTTTDHASSNSNTDGAVAGSMSSSTTSPSTTSRSTNHTSSSSTSPSDCKSLVEEHKSEPQTTCVSQLEANVYPATRNSSALHPNTTPVSTDRVKDAVNDETSVVVQYMLSIEENENGESRHK